MIDILVKSLLLLSPIVYGVNINLDHFDLRFFQIATMALFVASLFDKPKRDLTILKIPIALLLGLVVINSFWHKYQPLDIRTVEDLFFGILAFYILCVYLKKSKECIPYILGALGINLLVSIFQRIGYSPMLSFGRYGVYIGCEGGMLGSWIRLSVYIALIFPFIWEYKKWLAVLLIIFLALFYRRYPQWTIYIPCAVLFFVRCKKLWLKFFVGIAIIAVLGIFHQKVLASFAMRWQSWRPLLDMYFKQPGLGYGLGTYYIWAGREPFNSFLPFIYGLGIASVVWLGYVLRIFIHRFDKSIEATAVLTFLLVSLIEYPIEIPRLWFTIIFILAAWTIKQEVENGVDKSGI